MNSGGQPFNALAGGEVRHGLKRGYIFGPAIRVARVIHRVHTNENVVRAQHFRPAERDSQENGIARGHVSYRNACGFFFGYGNGGVGERRATNAVEIEGNHLVLHTAVGTRYAFGGVQFRPVALAVVEAQRIAGVALRARHGQHGGGIEAARYQHHGALAAVCISARAHRSITVCATVAACAPVAGR